MCPLRFKAWLGENCIVWILQMKCLCNGICSSWLSEGNNNDMDSPLLYSLKIYYYIAWRLIFPLLNFLQWLDLTSIRWILLFVSKKKIKWRRETEWCMVWLVSFFNWFSIGLMYCSLPEGGKNFCYNLLCWLQIKLSS